MSSGDADLECLLTYVELTLTDAAAIANTFAAQGYQVRSLVELHPEEHYPILLASTILAEVPPHVRTLICNCSNGFISPSLVFDLDCSVLTFSLDDTEILCPDGLANLEMFLAFCRSCTAALGPFVHGLFCTEEFSAEDVTLSLVAGKAFDRDLFSPDRAPKYLSWYQRSTDPLERTP